MLKFIRRHFSHILLMALWLGIVVTNYQWDTWLTGWDNLHPEINPLLDLSRGFNAVWQEYQGLGLLGGMAHAADFFRQIVVVLISIVLPQSLVRYVLLMGMLLAGTLGARRLFEFIFTRTQPVALVTAGANFAAMFYLLNIGTVQNFYVAFEPYYWFFGTLPWLLYFLMRAWSNGKTTSWALFLLLSFLASPSYYIQTNFVVYAALLATIGAVYLLQTLRKQHPHTPLQSLNNLSQTLVLILIANAFWILPQVYFVITGGSAVTMNSHINQIATPEVTVENEVFANPIDIMLLRGYWWNFTDYSYSSDAYEYFMAPWLQHAPTMVLGIVLAVACLAGAIYCWTDHRARSRVVAHQFGSFLPLAVVMAFGTMVFLLLCHLFHLPLLSQIFRSPFTKVIASLSLLYALLVGSSLFFIAQLLGNRVSVWIKKVRLISWSLSVALMLLVVCYSWPAFQGNFIYRRLHSRLPEAYFRLFDFMATQPEQSRMALLPADSQYGWQFYSWGDYRGIGFYWFGLKQPILARAFDVWSKEDEDFYQELLWARHDTSPATLERVLAKYGVRYLLFDSAIILPRKQEHNYNDAWRTLIQATPSCKQVFNEALLTVYDCGEPRDGFVMAPKSFYYTRRTNRQVFYDVAAVVPSGSVYLSTTDPKVEQEVRSQVGTEAFWPWAFLYQREIVPERLVVASQTSDCAQITLTADLHANLASPPVANKLVAPAQEAGVPLTLLVKPRVQGDHWQLVFTHPASLEVNQQAQTIFQDVVIDLPALANTSEDFYVDFGTSNTLFSSVAGAPEQFITLPHLNSDQRWTVFPASAVTDETDRGLVVEGGLAETMVVDKSVWTPYLRPQTIVLPASLMDLKLKVIAPMAQMRNDIFEEGVNCDSMKRGWTSKIDAGAQQDYWSLAFGASCDNFFHDSLDISRSSYLLTVTARNDIGLPFHYYIWDDDLHASAWENLFEEGVSERVLSLVQMPKHQEGSTIDWHLANRSLMGEEARNSLVVTPVIYGLDSRWLAQIQLTGVDGSSEVPVVENGLMVTDQSKFGTSHYWAQVSHGGGGRSGLLVLEQGFHEAWRASINGQKLTHVRAKGWANGWLVPADLCRGECEVKITFWPQWLQWWGLVISVGAAIGGGVWWGLGRYRAWCDAKACVRPLPEIKFRQMRQQVREQFLGKDKVPVVWQEHQEEVSK